MKVKNRKAKAPKAEPVATRGELRDALLIKLNATKANLSRLIGVVQSCEPEPGTAQAVHLANILKGWPTYLMQTAVDTQILTAHYTEHLK